MINTSTKQKNQWKLQAGFLLALFVLLNSSLTAQASPSASPYQLGSPYERIRKPYLDENPLAKSTLEAQQELKNGPGPIKDHAAPPQTFQSQAIFPAPHPQNTVVDGSKIGTIGMSHVKQSMGLTKSTEPEAPLTMGGVQSTMAALNEQDRQLRNDPDNARAPTLAGASALSNYAANNMAEAAVSQAMGAIQFTQHYLVNFTAKSGSSWQSLRNNLFIPIAILLLLPGAVLAQVRAIVAQSSSILGEVNPFEGITRSIVAIFMIPASFLVVNYGIDLANALTYGISNEYQKLFGTDMYQDAQCAEMRAFPVNSTSQNMNALLPFNIPSIMGKDPWTSFEGAAVAQKLFDPCVGLNQSLIPDEAASSTMNVNRMMMNGSNSFLAMTWNIMCAFQTVFLYYLWCMGPVVAALWVWPMERLRSALPSWIEGVITLCFWSLFWNVVVLLIACFRGVSETGTVIMTALNSLAPISVWYAFDFSALISEGAGYSMMNAISASLSQAARSGGGGGGGGGQKQASGGGGGGSRQAAGGGMGPGFMGAGGAMAHAGSVPGNGMGGGAYGGAGIPVAFGGSTGGLSPGGIGSAGMGAGNIAGLGTSGPTPGTPGLMPRGGGSTLPILSTASSGSQIGGSSYNASISNANDQINQSNLAQRQQQAQQSQQTQQAQQNSYMQAFAQDQARQRQEAQQQANAQQQVQQEQKQREAAMAMLGQQAIERQLQQTNMQNSEQARLASSPNNRLGIPDMAGDLPPQVSKANLLNTADASGSIGGAGAGNLLSGAGLPPLSGGDLSRSSTDLTDPLLLSQTAGGTIPGGSLPDLPPITTFSAGDLSSAPPVVSTSTSYTTVDGNSLPEIYSYTTTTDASVPLTGQTADVYATDNSYASPAGTEYTYLGNNYTSSSNDYTSSGTDPVYRTEQSVNWSNADNNVSREVVSDQSAIIQSANYAQSQTQYMNQVSAEQQIQQQQAQQQIQYVPAEIRQERVEVQQVQQPAKQVQETIVQQQPKQPPQPTKPNVQKTINTVFPLISSPPAAPKGGISSLIAGMQKGGKPGANQNNNQNNQNISGGTLSRDSNAKTEQETTKAGSLAEHLSRLQRGGGRTAPKAKDILSEAGLPPQSESKDEEEQDIQ